MRFYSDLNAHSRTLRKLKSMLLLGLLRRIRYKKLIKRGLVFSLLQIIHNFKRISKLLIHIMFLSEQ